MNCETFQTILQDLGKDVSLNLRTRQDGLAHAEVCLHCAALLKDECRLMAGLGALAASVADAEASPRVEAVLLNAFRARGIKQETGVEATQPLPNSPGAGSGRTLSFPIPQVGARDEHFSPDYRTSFWQRRLARTAAATLLAVGLVAWLSWQSSNRKSEWVAGPIPAALPAEESQAGPPKISLPRMPGASQTDTALSLPPKAGSHSTARKPVEQAPRAHRPALQPDLKESELESYATLDQTEVATEFLPLSYGEPIAPSLQGGQLVRVRLPRTTLLSFGFPMSEERAPEPIKADVLLGEDGMARAIRFVHSVE